MDEPEIQEESAWTLPVKLFSATSNTFGLVVAGKYQSLQGTVIASSKKWYSLSIVGRGANGEGQSATAQPQAKIIVPHHQVLVSKVKPFLSEDDVSSEMAEEEGAYFGVMPSPTGTGRWPGPGSG